MSEYFTRQNISKEDLLKDRDFLFDASIYMSERTGETFNTNEELYEAFVEHRRKSSVNEIDAYKDFKYVSGSDEETKTRAGKLFLTFDSMSNPTSFWQKMGDYAEGLAKAPSTYFSVVPGLGLGAKFGLSGATAAFSKGVATGTVRTIGQTAKALAGKSVKRRALEGAVAAGTVEGAIGGLQGGLAAASRKETDIEPYKDVSITRGTLTGAAFGAVPGVVIGGGIAARTAVGEKKALQILQEGLAARRERLKVGKTAAIALSRSKNQEERNLFEKVSKSLDPLSERLAKQIKEGQETKKQFMPNFLRDDFTATLNEDVIASMKGAAVEMLIAAGIKASDFHPKARLSEMLHKGLTITKKGEKLSADDLGVKTISGDKLVEIMNKYGLTQDQLANVFLAEMSQAGKILAIGGQSKRLVLRALAEEHKILEKLKLGDRDMGEALRLFEKNPGAVRQLFANIDKARLGLMTIQTATTARNTANAASRTALFSLDNLGHGILDIAFSPLSGRGMAETARQGARRALSGGRLYKSMTWDASEANALRLLFADEMPKTFSRLYRQNADISAALGLGSGFANFSRKLNVLNTYSDNAFKRAIFMTELQNLVGVKKLRTLMREGKFNTIDTQTIAKAMDEAMSFTYQKSYRGINGEKTAVSDFLQRMSTPATTWLIPFPKFIMNSVEFMYTHAPIIGLADVPFRAAKMGANKGFLLKQRVAKQLTGMGMLYGAIQLRAQQGPDAKWWEWYDKDTGQYENALAFYGPFAAYMFAADLILRSNFRNQKVQELTGLPSGDVPLVIGEQTRKNWARVADDGITQAFFTDESDTKAQFLKAIFGSTFRTGTGLDMVEALARDTATNIGDKDFSGFKRTIAKFGGNYVNTFGVGLGEIRDIYGLVDDRYKVIRDPEAMVNHMDLFIATATRSMPISDEGYLFGLVKGPEGIAKPARSATIPGELTREGSGRKQLTGRGTKRAKDVIQRALDTHRIPRYRAFPKIKNPELNDIAKDIYNEYSEKRLMPILASSSYRDVPETPEGGRIQKLRLLNILDLTKTQVHDEVINRVGRNLRDLQASSPEATEQIEKLEGQLEYMFKLQFSSFSGTIRRQAELAFEKKPTNWEDWQKLYDIGKTLKTNK
tara:strand:+ start:5709 stop:9092 length:3384 start_codon:yes stop_codon:yes gene_type:complete